MSNEAADAINRQTGKTARACRMVKGMTQARLAELIGTDPRGVVLLEQGKSPWTAARIIAVARALGCDAAMLLPATSKTDEVCAG